MNKNTIIAIVIGVVVLAAAAYMLFFNGDTNVVTEGIPVTPAETTFVNLAAQLEPLGFDTSILSDPRFTALQDIHTAIVPEASGRKDPFAPIPGLSTK